MKSWERDVRKLARQYGFNHFEIAKNGHFRMSDDFGNFITCSQSPSCPFALKKIENDLKKCKRRRNL